MGNVLTTMGITEKNKNKYQTCNNSICSKHVHSFISLSVFSWHNKQPTLQHFGQQKSTESGTHCGLFTRSLNEVC